MLVLVIGLIIVLGIHLLPTKPALRDQLKDKIGVGPYRGLFSLVALFGFAAIIWGYGLARMDPIVIYTPPDWGRQVAWGLMAISFTLLTATYLPGRIAAAVKHPMVTSLKVWAFAHLLANGTLADVLLFGGFLAYGVIARISLKKRNAEGAVAGPNALRNDLLAVTLGGITWVVFFLWLHRILIGVPVH